MKREVRWYSCLVFILLAVGVIILSGCKHLQADLDITGTDESADATAKIAVPSAASQQTQPTKTQTILVPTFPPPGYPAPDLPGTIAPTQNSTAYPPPATGTQLEVSTTLTPTSPAADTLANNPYPVRETPVPLPQELSNASPYPPPPEVVQPVPSASPSPNAAPSPSAQPIVTGIVPTPQVAIVRTQLVATDPALVTLEAGRPQMVLFFADWCPLCKSLAPVVLGIESQYSDRMNFIYLDVDDPATIDLKSELNYRIIARPRLYLLDPQGAILRDWTGYVTLEEVQAAIDAIGTASP